MNNRDVAKIERARLADAMLEHGPDVPTLCEGWTNYDMAAHLVVREHRPLASAGIAIKPLESWHDNAIVKAKERHSFQSLVERFRNGPPLHWIAVDGLFNAQEYFIHDEDVRRGEGDHTPRPEAEIGDVEAALWAMVKRAKGYAVRGIKGVGVDLVLPDGETVHARKGDDTVSLVGRPGEIVLYLAGRKGAAQVKLEGAPEAIAKVEGAKLGW